MGEHILPFPPPVGGLLTPLTGAQIFTVPDAFKVTRSWRERLLTWPWRPWVAVEYRDNPAAPKRGEILSFGNRLFMRESDFANLKREIT